MANVCTWSQPCIPRLVLELPAESQSLLLFAVPLIVRASSRAVTTPTAVWLHSFWTPSLLVLFCVLFIYRESAAKQWTIDVGKQVSNRFKIFLISPLSWTQDYPSCFNGLYNTVIRSSCVLFIWLLLACLPYITCVRDTLSQNPTLPFMFIVSGYNGILSSIYTTQAKKSISY